MFLVFLVHFVTSKKDHLQPLKAVAFDLCNKGFPRFAQKLHSLPPFGREEADPCEGDEQCKSNKCNCLVDGSKQCANACDGVLCPEAPKGGCFDQAECDPTTGGCFAPRPKAPMSPCDDGKPDTINDRCSSSGVCGAAGDDDILGGFCGHNSQSSKEMPCGDNTDCKTGGCGDEICQHVKEPPIASSCLHRSCFEAEEYKVVCKCRDSACQWRPEGEKLVGDSTAAPTETGPSTDKPSAEEVTVLAAPAPATAPSQPGAV